MSAVLNFIREARDNILRVTVVLSLYLYMLIVSIAFGWVDIVRRAWAVVHRPKCFPFVKFFKWYLKEDN